MVRKLTEKQQGLSWNLITRVYTLALSTRLGYWVIQVSGRKATSMHTHQFAHSSPETLNLLMQRRLKCLTLSGGKGDWEFNGRKFRRDVHHALTTMSATTDSV